MNLASANALPGARRGAGWNGGAASVAGLNAALLRSRPISVHRNVLQMVGSASAGILLSQLIYWTRHGAEVVQRDGWIFKTADQWHHETGMTWKVQRRARRRLCQLGLMEERRVSLPCRLEFRLNLNVLASKTSEHIRIQIENLSLDLFRSDSSFVREMLGPVLSYHRMLANLVPHVNDALLLSRCLFSMRRSDGSFREPSWLSMSRDDWHKETVLSRDEWETGRRHLRFAGLLLEKHANYPRRVDVMVHTDNLVAQLQAFRAEKLSTGAESAETHVSPCRDDVRGDRAIQDTGKAGTGPNPPIGGNGRNRTPVFQGSISPIPPFKNRPIPPSRIARSPLYKRELLQEEQLQEQLHLAAVAAVDVHAVDTGGGVGFFTSPIPTLPPTTFIAGQGTSLDENTVGTPWQVDDFHWPNKIDEDDRPVVLRHASGLTRNGFQELLDEMSWQHTHGAIRNPMAYLRKLRQSCDEGIFVAEGAHKVAADRVKNTVRAAAEKHRQAQVLASAGETPLQIGPSREESVARLRQIRGALVARSGAPR